MKTNEAPLVAHRSPGVVCFMYYIAKLHAHEEYMNYFRRGGIGSYVGRVHYVRAASRERERERENITAAEQ